MMIKKLLTIRAAKLLGIHFETLDFADFLISFFSLR